MRRHLLRRLALVGVAALAGLLSGSGRAQQEDLLPEDAAGFLPPGELLRPETTLAALMGLEVDRQIEQRLLVADLERLVAWNARRDRALERLRALYGDLDGAFSTDPDATAAANAGDLERRILDLESRLFGIGGEGRDLRQRIQERRLRLGILTAKMNEITALLPADADTLTGIWDVTMAPVDEDGVFSLYQTGTLLTGEYALEGGWHGSLEGTVIDGKVYLERIDARKGRFASFSGRLDPDGRTIRGTWQERDLTANRPVEGQWLAHRRPRQNRPEP